MQHNNKKRRMKRSIHRILRRFFFHSESSWKKKYECECISKWIPACMREQNVWKNSIHAHIYGRQRENSLHTNVLLIFHYKIIYISISILEKAFILAPLYGKLKMKPDVHETLKVRQDKNLYSAPDVIIVQLFHKPYHHSIAHCSGQVSRSSCLNI